MTRLNTGSAPMSCRQKADILRYALEMEDEQ